MKTIVPLPVSDAGQLRVMISDLPDTVDLVELWLDQLHTQPNWKELVADLAQQKPLLGVCKSVDAGGSFDKSGYEKQQIYGQFLAAGGTLIDIDYMHDLSLCKAFLPEQIILSYHNFHAVPSDLNAIWKAMKETPAAMRKLAVTAKNELELEHFMAFLRSQNEPMIATIMGKMGSVGRSRIALQELTWGQFVAYDEDHKTAMGQPVLF